MRVNWLNLLTVSSATILVGAMVLPLGFATGWALGGLLGLGEAGAYLFEAAFLSLGAVALIAFVRSAHQAEPVFQPRNNPETSNADLPADPDQSIRSDRTDAGDVT